MKPIAITPPFGRIAGLTVAINDSDAQSFQVEFEDDGNGFFARLKCDDDEGGILLDPADGKALGDWIQATCSALDQQKTHLGERG